MTRITKSIKQVSDKRPRIVSVINLLWVGLGGMWAVVSAAGPDITYIEILKTPGIMIPAVLAGLGALNAILSRSPLD